MPRRAALLAALALLAGAGTALGAPLPGAPGCPILPPGNVWNARVDRLPVRADSDLLTASIGLDAGLHPDFSAAGRYGIPHQRRAPLHAAAGGAVRIRQRI